MRLRTIPSGIGRYRPFLDETSDFGWFRRKRSIWTVALALRQKGYRSDEGLTLETSAFLPFTVANLRFQPSC